MKYLVSASQMKQYDSNTINMLGIPALVLMERAAAATAYEIQKRHSIKAKVMIIAGTGNNGGDGLAVGRILQEDQYDVTYFLVGNKNKISSETHCQLQILKNCGQAVRFIEDEKDISELKGDFDIIVDALFGIGLSREITGLYDLVIGYMNHSAAWTVSVDIPSGIDADSGRIMGNAVQADLTVTFGFYKCGLLLYPGCIYAGDVICAKMGITELAFCNQKPERYFYEKSDLRRLPKRKPDGNKGTFGKLLIIAGSHNMCGAASFCAKAAYRMGTGLVRVYTNEVNREILQTAVPEAVLTTCQNEIDLNELKRDMEWANCVLIGPGIGMEEAAEKKVEFVMKNCEKPLIADADALNLLAMHPDWLKYQTELKRDFVITPHMGEFSRILNKSIKCCKENQWILSKELSKTYHMCVVCKDARTVVSSKTESCLNISGNDGMATAGAGDVLSGMIAGLMAQGMEGFQAAKLGTYIHGLSGDAAAKKLSAESVMAGDIVECIPEVISAGKNMTE